MTNGTAFTIWGVAGNGGRVRLMREDRIKVDGGSRVTSRVWCDETWPDTRAGRKAAADETAVRNVAEARRVGLSS